MKTFQAVVKKRNEKREKQLAKLEEQRQSQWNDELLKTIVSALPKSTPKKIQSTRDEIAKGSECQLEQADGTLDAIGMLRENLNGGHPSVLSSDPFNVLWSETLAVCSTQTHKWKYVPIILVHPFANRIDIMTVVTGKKMHQNNLSQMNKVSQRIRDNISNDCHNILKSGNEQNIIDGLREKYPKVLKGTDDTAINHFLSEGDDDQSPHENSDDEPGLNDNIFRNNDAEIPESVDNEEKGDVDGANTDHGNESDANSDATVSFQKLSIGDDTPNELTVGPRLQHLRRDPVTRLPTPEIPENENKNTVASQEDDFSSSMTDSFMLESTKIVPTEPRYAAVPPPPKPVGAYSQVPPPKPLESQKLKEIATSSPVGSQPKQMEFLGYTPGRMSEAGKRLASPLDEQPEKIIKYATPEAEIKALRRELLLSSQKVDRMHEMMEQLVTQTPTQLPSQEQQHSESRRRRSRSRKNSEQMQRDDDEYQRLLDSADSGIQQLSPISPIQGHLRTTTRERTIKLINNEPLGGRLPPTPQSSRTISTGLDRIVESNQYETQSMPAERAQNHHRRYNPRTNRGRRPRHPFLRNSRNNQEYGNDNRYHQY